MIRNLPNLLTLLRIPLLFGILLVSELNIGYSYTIILGLLILSMISDFLDGFLARKMNVVSDFGKIADPLLDKVFILGLFMWMLTTGIIPSWNLGLILLLLLRELAVTGLRGSGGSGEKPTFGADWFGKWKTTLLFLSLSLFLIVEMLKQDYDLNGVTLVWGFRLALVTLWTGSMLGLYSGYRYFKRFG